MGEGIRVHWTITQAPTAPPSSSSCAATYGAVQGTVHMQVEAPSAERLTLAFPTAQPGVAAPAIAGWISTEDQSLQVAAFRVRLAPGPDGPDIQLPYPTPPRAGARRPPGVAASPPPPPPEDPKPYGNGVWWPLEVPKPYEWTVGRAAVILPPDMLSGDSVTDLRVAVCFTAATIPAGIIGMDTFIATLKPGASLLTARRGTTNGFAGHHHHHRHYQHRRALQSQLSGEEHEQEFQQQGGLLAEQQDPAVGSDAGVGRRLTSHEGTPPSDVNFDLPPPYRPPPPWPPGQAVVLGNTVVAQLGRGGRRVLLLRRAGIQAACIVGCLQVGMTLGVSFQPHDLGGLEYDIAYAMLLQQAAPIADVDGGGIVGAWVGSARPTFVSRKAAPPPAAVPAASCTDLRYPDGSLRSSPCDTMSWCMCWGN